jgi:deoxyribodipyrimidine photolyase-related protein
MTKRILYVPFDHLNLTKGVLKELDPKNDVVVLVESNRMITGRELNEPTGKWTQASI